MDELLELSGLFDFGFPQDKFMGQMIVLTRGTINKKILRDRLAIYHKFYKEAIKEGYKKFESIKGNTHSIIDYIVNKTGFTRDEIYSFLLTLEMLAQDGKIDFSMWDYRPDMDLKNVVSVKNIKSGFKQAGIITIALSVLGTVIVLKVI